MIDNERRGDFDMTGNNSRSYNSSNVEIDQSVRDRICSELDTSFFIDAGAGAGKTSLIVDRVAALLKNGKAKASEIVVITFTNASAAELRGRISEKVRGFEVNGEEIRVEDMIISTIHHFCNILIKQRAFDLSLGLSAELMEESGEERKLKEKYFKDYYMNNYNNSSIIELKELWGYQCKSKMLATFIDMSEEEFLDYQLDNILLKKANKDYFDDAYMRTKNMLSTIESKYKSIEHEVQGFIGNIKSGLEEAIAEYDEGRYSAPLEYLYKYKWYSVFGKFKKGSKKENEIKNKKVEEYNEALEKELEKFLFNENEKAEYEAYKNSKLVKYVIEIVSAYQEERDKNKITNDHLLVLAAKLSENKEAISYIQKKYRYVFVDEYQDTDDMQTALIWNIARDYDKEPAKKSKTSKLMPDEGMALRDGGLVVVGDDKQSIYRFRGADAVLFGRMRERMEKAKELKDINGNSINKVDSVRLSVNFRSNDDIITWVNSEFNERFAACGVNDYYDMKVSKVRNSFTGDVIKGVYHASGNTPKDVANLINDLKASGLKIAVKNNNKYIAREICNSDIMVLTFYGTHISDYALELKKNNIPVQLYGKINVKQYNLLMLKAWVDYFISPYRNTNLAKIIQFLACKDYMAISDTERKIYSEYVKSIRAKVIGLSASELVGYFSNNIALIEPALIKKDDDNLDVYLMESRKRINSFFEEMLASGCQSLNELSDFINVYFEEKHEREAELEEGRDAVRIMNLHKAKGLQAPIIIIADRTEKIGESNVHCNDYKEDRLCYKTTKKFSRYEAGKIETDGCTYANNPDIIKKSKAADALDTTRLEYVETTRAAEVLIFMDSEEKDGVITCALGGVEEKLRNIEKEIDERTYKESDNDTNIEPKHNTDDIVDNNSEEVIAEASQDKDIEAEKMLGEELSSEEWLNESKKAVFYVINPSSMEKNTEKRKDKENIKTEKVNRDNINIREDDQVKADKDNAGEKAIKNKKNEQRPKGNIFGTFMHRCFELTVNRRKRLKSSDDKQKDHMLKAVIKQAIMELQGQLSQDDKKLFMDFMLEKLKIFVDSSLMKDIYEATEVYTEYSFSYYLYDDEALELLEDLSEYKGNLRDIINTYKESTEFDRAPLWINGTADLILIKDDDVLIVDYKSDEMKNDESLEEFIESKNYKYAGQLELYRKAINHLMKKNNIETKLYTLYSDKSE